MACGKEQCSCLDLRTPPGWPASGALSVILRTDSGRLPRWTCTRSELMPCRRYEQLSTRSVITAAANESVKLDDAGGTRSYQWTKLAIHQPVLAGLEKCLQRKSLKSKLRRPSLLPSEPVLKWSSCQHSLVVRTDTTVATGRPGRSKLPRLSSSAQAFRRKSAF